MATRLPVPALRGRAEASSLRFHPRAGSGLADAAEYQAVFLSSKVLGLGDERDATSDYTPTRKATAPGVGEQLKELKIVDRRPNPDPVDGARDQGNRGPTEWFCPMRIKWRCAI